MGGQESVFVKAAAQGEVNAWGVKRPGKPLSFKHEKAEFLGHGEHISCRGQQVCRTYRVGDQGGAPAAKDMPNLLNIVLEDTHTHAKYLDDTCNAIFKQASAAAKQISEAERTLDTLVQGAGVEEVHARLDTVREQVHGLEVALQEADATAASHRMRLEEHGKQLEALLEDLRSERAAFEEASSCQLVTKAEHESLDAELRSQLQKLDQRLDELDRELQKKSVCEMMCRKLAALVRA